MTLQKLDNRTWGFPSGCFVCDPDNPTGLRIPFFHDDERDVVSDVRGRPCVPAEAGFVPLTARRAAAAIGDVSGGDAAFVKG